VEPVVRDEEALDRVWPRSLEELEQLRVRALVFANALRQERSWVYVLSNEVESNRLGRLRRFSAKLGGLHGDGVFASGAK
jgi:hypothetical protein